MIMLPPPHTSTSIISKILFNHQILITKYTLESNICSMMTQRRSQALSTKPEPTFFSHNASPDCSPLPICSCYYKPSVRLSKNDAHETDQLGGRRSKVYEEMWKTSCSRNKFKHSLCRLMRTCITYTWISFFENKVFRNFLKQQIYRKMVEYSEYTI